VLIINWASSSLVKPKHFLPKSFNDTPIWISQIAISNSQIQFGLIESKNNQEIGACLLLAKMFQLHHFRAK